MHLTRLSVAITPAVILVLFASTLVGIDRLAFRDVSHFYTPLYQYVAERAHAEWFPLWNPLDQTGIPLVGETTTAVLYPVRYALFALPISSEVAMGWYVALHLILASLSARTAARWAGATSRAANIAGAIYPLSGSVLFLHANPPFLVGAAWLPLVLGSLLGRRWENNATRCLIAGPSMAMMILGGDPQTAMHAMMVAGVVWLWRFARSKWQRKPDSSGTTRYGFALVGAPLFAAALAAPQIASSVSWSRQSDRIRGVDKTDWMQPPQVGSHRNDAFQFSIPPWHWAELLTPNAFGSHLPLNRRLSVLVPGDGRMWTPSLYMGMLAAISLVCRMATWRRDGADVWSVTAVASLVVCLGSFGAVWCVQTCTGYLADVHEAIGGAYWWLYQIVPGYSSFRYPAKWLPIFALATSIVTARWLDRGVWKHPVVTSRMIAALLTTLLVALLSVTWLRLNPTQLTDPLTVWPTDRFFGPLDVAGGLYQIQWSLLHSIGVLAVVLLVTRLHRVGRCSRHIAVWALCGVTVAEVAISGGPLIARVSITEEQQLIAQLNDSRGDDAPIVSRRMRTQSDGGWPKSWRRTCDINRLTDTSTSERIAEFGRWHLTSGQGMLNNVVSIQNHDMALFWTAAAQLTSNMNQSERTKFWHAVRRWLSIHHVVHTSDRVREIVADHRTSSLVDVTRVDEDGTRAVYQFHPRWTIANDLADKPSRFIELLNDVRLHAESTTPLIITSKKVPVSGMNAPAVQPTIEATVEQSGYVELALKNSAPGLLTRPAYQDGHWRAESKSNGEDDWLPLDVYKVNFLAQGVVLPSNCNAVRFTYAPFWFPWTIALSGLAWTLLLITVWRTCRLP